MYKLLQTLYSLYSLFSPTLSFTLFTSYSVQVEPLEVGRAVIMTTREVKPDPRHITREQ